MKIYDEIVAEALAIDKHKNLFDMQGNPAIWHIERVANRVSKKYDDPSLTCIAWLHDIVEDTNVTIEQIYEMFSLRVGKGVELLTHKDNQNYMEYISDIRQSPDARCVKIEDLKDNLERGKVGLDKATSDRLLSKHQQALDFLISNK